MATSINQALHDIANGLTDRCQPGNLTDCKCMRGRVEAGLDDVAAGRVFE